MAVTVADLSAPMSGQFFRLNAPLTVAEVNQIFDETILPATGPLEGRDPRVPLSFGNTNYWSSFLCFPIEGAPSFLPNTALREKKYAFLLLLELSHSGKWFLGVFKSGLAGLSDALEALCMPISRRAFLRAFSKDSKFEKLSSKRMTVSQNELRGSSYEAADLAATLPSLAVTRSVPRLLRLQHKGQGSISITVGTSRIHKSGSRTGITNLARLLLNVARETERKISNEFLDAFPASVDFDKKPKTLAPNGVLFDWWPLLQNSALELKWTTKNGNALTIRSKRFLTAVGGVLTPRRHGKEWILKNENSVTIGRLRENTRAYAIAELLDQKVTIANGETGQEQTLTTWIREQQAFQIAFSSPEYFYTAGHLYRRAGFERDIQLVRGIMRSHPALAAVNSEKGRPQPKSAADTAFPANSIFRFIEDVHCIPREYLWCSDLGDEWADYIVLQPQRIVFAHCKHGDVTLGATDYQEVVGQALKNLGRLQAMPDAFVAKVKAAASTNTWGSTGIVRLRDGEPWVAFEAAIDQRLRNPDVAREVHLVISMLSAAQYDAAAAAQRKRANFIQLVWLLASFMNSTREFGGKPVIVCAP
jgi:hypothetical protein